MPPPMEAWILLKNIYPKQGKAKQQRISSLDQQLTQLMTPLQARLFIASMAFGSLKASKRAKLPTRYNWFVRERK